MAYKIMATGETKKATIEASLIEKIASETSSRRADCDKSFSSVWRGSKTNEGSERGRLFFGNNTDALRMLTEIDDAKESVKLIYVDPPFATNQVFVSRSRNGGYSDLLTGKDYLDYLRTLFVMSHCLLSKDGSLYVHLDDNMVFEVKLLLDEIFGKQNFRNMIVRKKCNPKNYTKKKYGNISDYILFYTKSNNYTWNRPYIEWGYEEALREYPYIEEVTNRRYKRVPIHAPGVRNGDTGLPWRGMNPPPGKHWQYKRSTLDEMDKRGEIYWSLNGNPRRKVYLDESKGIPVQDIWMDYRDAHNQNVKITGYPTEKNQCLLERIVQASSDEDDLVLDFFSGSGTTLGVASSMNRRWIGVDNSIDAIDATIARFAHGLQPMGDYVSTNSNEQTSLFENEMSEDALSDMVIYSQKYNIDSPELRQLMDKLK
jgi:adenine-specific DNA-methyltransferase